MNTRKAHPRNQCGQCFLDFSSVEGFDRHRVGSTEFTFIEGMRMNPPREDGRRCLDEDELRARGFAQDKRGLWGEVARRERARKNFRREAPSAQEVK